MKKLAKIAIEGIAILLVLALAALIILALFTKNIQQSWYDTFTGDVSKTPTTITSPVYGQVTSLPVQEGQSVRTGQVLAVINIIQQTEHLALNSALYQVQGNTLRVLAQSPGIVGGLNLTPFSTVAVTGPLMTLYTTDSIHIHVLLPQGYALSDYTSFYAGHPPNLARYALRIAGQVPTDVISNIDPTTSVYLATCTHCQAILDNEAVVVYAQKQHVESPFFKDLVSFWNTIQHYF